MQYTLSMTSRMLAIAALCVFLLCVLLFLLGIELGKRMAEPDVVQLPASSSPTGTVVVAPSALAVPAAPAVPALPAAPGMPAIVATPKP